LGPFASLRDADFRALGLNALDSSQVGTHSSIRSPSFPHAFSGNPGGRTGPPLETCGGDSWVNHFCVAVLA